MLEDFKEQGIQSIDLTFYGTKEYHDHFAGRIGDYNYLMMNLKEANQLGIKVQAGIPMTQENIHQLDELYEELVKEDISKICFFIPHSEERGKSLDKIRFTEKDDHQFSDKVKKHFIHHKYKIEKKWNEEANFTEWAKRVLTISLTPGNIDFFESLPFDETIAYLEKLDDTYYEVVPPLQELSKHTRHHRMKSIIVKEI